MPSDAVAAKDESMNVGSRAELLALGRYLHRIGYHSTAVTPATHEIVNQRQANGRAKDLRGILGWSRPFARDAVSDQEFRLMRDAGVIVPDGDHWRSTLRWSSLGDLLCAHSAFPTDAGDAVFFGPDTYRFARFVNAWLDGDDRQVERAVDIGCGSGAGALLVGKAMPGADVLAVDINPHALQLTALNAQLAGTANVTAVQSNLLGDVDGDFDLIISNPPYMVDSRERAYRHGGDRLGAGLSVQIVESALARLTPGGTLLLYTGVAITGGRDLFLETLRAILAHSPHPWRYEELDPDVFGEELMKPAYADVERIAAVGLTLRRTRS